MSLPLDSELRPSALEAIQTDLIAGYNQRAVRAAGIIRDGQVVDNPILTGQTPDTKYSVTTLGLYTGPAEAFLANATGQLRDADPHFVAVPEGFRHITLRDFAFNTAGRKSPDAPQIGAAEVRAYYQALRKSLAQPTGPIHLRLQQILPVVDGAQNSITVVGGFIPVDLGILDVKNRMTQAITAAGLNLVERPGGYPVIFSSLGRFRHPPTVDGERIPLLDALANINNQVSEQTSPARIEQIDVVSTNPKHWSRVEKHVFILPPISLTSENQPHEGRFAKPKSRVIFPESTS